MGIGTGINWADHTWNPWQGCTKVSAGCRNCYMYRDKNRYGQDPAVVVRSVEATFRLPLSNKIKAGDRVFTCSWSDWFHPAADKWRADAWQVIRLRDDVNFLIVTKRPERIAECLPSDWNGGWKNVWLGVTAENQETADERIPLLLATPAAIRFVSCEPLLGPVSLDRIEEDELGTTLNALTGAYSGNDSLFPRLDWIIAGGESGPEARPCALEWVQGVVSQCRKAHVPVWVKQLGAFVVSEERRWENPSEEDVKLCGLHPDGWAWRAGTRDRNGADLGEWPEDLQVRELPEVTA